MCLLKSNVENCNVRGRPPVRWTDHVYEYLRKGGSRLGVEHAERKHQNRERWSLSCSDHPHGGVLRGGRGIRDIDISRIYIHRKTEKWQQFH